MNNNYRFIVSIAIGVSTIIIVAGVIELVSGRSMWGRSTITLTLPRTAMNEQDIEDYPTPAPAEAAPDAGCCEQVRVRGTGESGVFFRSEPERTSNVLRTLPEGAVLQVVGANRTVGDVVWRNVRDDDGNEGWVSAAFLETVE